ncbi:hypothetical protein [Marinococcus halotolerans]|uniref:hypothetical protein n=1 Tax=Marinococcus halotolerans TaxID=301092 RepID=UPI0004077A06|nr:hypothetical protein [Marinococcus halotolerans]
MTVPKEISNVDLPPFTPRNIISIDDLSYSYKDLHHEQIFKYEATTNVVITRLLFTLQEAYTCVWLYNGISGSDRLDLNNYILLRMLSIKADEIMDNLKNIQSFLQDDFKKIDSKCNYKLSSLISSFEGELAEECRYLRNMLHYNEEKTNFLDYIVTKHESDSTYVKTTIGSIVLNYMEPLYATISEYLNVENLKSMNDFEKIYKRLRTKIKSKMDKNN